jgi:hypothetical protein
VIGDQRRLKFELYHQAPKQEKVKPSIGGYFNLKHGSLFILNPNDEKPSIRNSLKKYGCTFYKHNCDEVKEKKGGMMSIGICFLCN